MSSRQVTKLLEDPQIARIFQRATGCCRHRGEQGLPHGAHRLVGAYASERWNGDKNAEEEEGGNTARSSVRRATTGRDRNAQYG